MPKFGGYDFALVVTCALTRFTRVFPVPIDAFPWGAGHGTLR